MGFPPHRTKRARQPSEATKMSQASKTKIARTSSPFPVEQLVPSDRISFLDLPAEIRNMIYEMVVDKLPEAYLSSRTRSNLACRCALPRVNHQVREEFLAVLYVRASKITATVQTFDFRHIVTFINRITDKERAALLPTTTAPDPIASTSSLREMKIELNLEGLSDVNLFEPIKLLRRWVRRRAHKDKKGTDINVTYELVGKPPKDISTWAVMQRVRMLRNGYDDGPARVELDKILLDAFQWHEE